MAEIALRTTERKSDRGWRPVGSTIVCLSDSLIRRKWLEIFCDLASPKKRHDPAFQNIPGWNRICEAWTPELRQAWLEYDRPTNQHKLGRLLMDNDYPQLVWDSFIEPTGVLADIPFAPESDKKAYDTWLWSEAERIRYFIIVNDDAEDEEVEGWQGAEEIDGVSVWKKQFDYISDPEISGKTMDDIANPDKILHPRFDKPIEAARMKQPKITDFKRIDL